MYFDFAWRYFKAKKSANAINIISRVTVGVIAFATCSQVLVLSVFNGFEDLVKSLYASFYTDLKIVPASGKIISLSPQQLRLLQSQPGVSQLSTIVEEKALLKNPLDESQSIPLQLKGVDKNFMATSGVDEKVTSGKFDLGTVDDPGIVIGDGIRNATGILIDPKLRPEPMTVILPRAHVTSNDPLESLSEGFVKTTGAFKIQQEFNNSYAFTNIGFIKQQSGFHENEFSAVEISLKPGEDMQKIKTQLQQQLGSKYTVQTLYEQNTSLYSTMKTEKWAIYAVFTLILIIAAFTMVSALTMLVLEKKQDIAILQSMGANSSQIKKIFLTEGILLGTIGAAIGIGVAVVICLSQIQFQWIKLTGGSFLVDYFPVKLVATDFLMVALTALIIATIAAWFPANKASKQALELKV